jgi:hypothetical protein
MKIIIPVMILIMLACANLGFTQVAPTYGPAQAQPIYGAPQAQPVYGPPQAQPMYGAPQVQPIYGSQQPQPGYGAPQAQQYVPPQAQQYVPPQAQQYGTPQAQQYGTPQAPSSLYDTSYTGLFNMYGQPTFIAPQYPMSAQQQAQQQQQPEDGLIFRGAAAVQSAGGYLWSYMPAPLRGADAGYFGPAGAGPTIINFTPGSR